MPNINPIDESNVTEFNSNHLTIYRLHKINERIQELLFMKMYEDALGALYDFYSEIEAKLIEFKKDDKVSEVTIAFRRAENRIANTSLPKQLVYKSLIEVRSALYKAANSVGVGMTTKDSGRGAAQYG